MLSCLLVFRGFGSKVGRWFVLGEAGGFDVGRTKGSLATIVVFQCFPVLPSMRYAVLPAQLQM